MGKCTKCGRRGLFVKVEDGVCKICKYEKELADVEFKLKQQTEMYEAALREAREKATQQAERELHALERDCNNLLDLKHKLSDRRDSLKAEIEKAENALKKATEAAEKLKPLAKGIEKAFEAARKGDAYFGARNDKSIETLIELVPDPELNCLTSKVLGTKYRNIRKQIIETCAEYEKTLKEMLERSHLYAYNNTKIHSIFIALMKMIVIAVDAQADQIMQKMRYDSISKAIEDIHDVFVNCRDICSFENADITQMFIRMYAQLESMYCQAAHVEHEFYIQREREKEEQRAIKEQMRQEAEERKRLEAEKKKMDAEANKYIAEIKRVSEQMKNADDEEMEALRARVAEVEGLLAKVDEKRKEITALQNGKAGTVYVISNIGSFGENVFKVGMTRRLDPQDRVNELGDASVPFPFDVHSFIWSEDAVALETALHHELNNRRVNRVNLRKEFFEISVDELQQMVQRIDPTATFKVTALAEQYRQSIAMKEQGETQDD